MLRIVIAGPDEVLSLRIGTVISPAQGIEVVGKAHDSASALELVCRTHPDVVLVDDLVPPQGGVALTAAITDAVPQTRVLLLTAETREDAVQAAFAAGALGVLARDGSNYVPRDLDESRPSSPSDCRAPCPTY